MIEINLLGEKNRRDCMLYNLARITAFLGYITVILILCFSGILFAYNKNIQKSLNVAKENVSSLSKTGSAKEEEMKKEIEKINEKIYFFDNTLKNHKEISPTIEELANVFPPEIKISLIDLQAGEDKCAIIIKGSSLTRADFLKLQSLMEKNSNFSNIESPLSNITKKENIDFVITSDMKNNILKQ